MPTWIKLFENFHPLPEVDVEAGEEADRELESWMPDIPRGLISTSASQPDLLIFITQAKYAQLLRSLNIM